MDMGGDFQILEIDIGKRKSDPSHARILVEAETPSLLNQILDELGEIGASIAEIKEVELKRAPMDRVLPDDFYSTPTTRPSSTMAVNGWRLRE